jgi:hypothetical protein
MLNLRKINARYEYAAEETAEGMFGSIPRSAAELREERLTLPANLKQPMPIHRAIMEQVDTILSVGLTDTRSNDVAMPLRAAMRLLRRLEPLMLEHLAEVPEEECFKALRILAMGITQLADSVENGSDARPALVPPAEQTVTP